LLGRQGFAPAVAVQHDVISKKRNELRSSATTRGFREASQELAMTRTIDIKAWTAFEYSRPSAAEDLTTGHSITPHHCSDFLYGQDEVPAQYQYRALRWPEPLEDSQHRDRHECVPHLWLDLGRRPLWHPVAAIGVGAGALITQANTAEQGRDRRNVRLERQD